MCFEEVLDTWKLNKPMKFQIRIRNVGFDSSGSNYLPITSSWIDYQKDQKFEFQSSVQLSSKNKKIRMTFMFALYEIFLSFAENNKIK